MKLTLAIVFIAVLTGQHYAGAAELGRRFGRQLVQENRIGTGAGNILDAAGEESAGNAVTDVSDADDGDLTNDLANTGQDVGTLQLDTFPAAGNSVPGRRRLSQANGAGGAAGLPGTVAGDVTGDATGAVQEVEQLAQDTVSNTGGGAALPTGRKLHQNAGTGAGCDAVFSDFDTSTGEGTENAEDNIAGDLSGAKGAGRRRLHQNAGTGAGCDAVFSDFDTSTGEGTENAEDNIAGDLGGHPMAAGGTGKKLLHV